jgi:hypothetical protein
MEGMRSRLALPTQLFFFALCVIPSPPTEAEEAPKQALLIELKPEIVARGEFATSEDERTTLVGALNQHEQATDEIVSLYFDNTRTSDSLSQEFWPDIDEWEKDSRVSLFWGLDDPVLRLGFDVDQRVDREALEERVQKFAGQARDLEPGDRLEQLVRLLLTELGSPLTTLNLSADAPPSTPQSLRSDPSQPSEKTVSSEGPSGAIGLIFAVMIALASVALYYRLHPEITFDGGEWAKRPPLTFWFDWIRKPENEDNTLAEEWGGGHASTR